MYQIRKSVFETNSSSVHTICIAKDPVSEKDMSGRLDFGRIGLKSYGWETEYYSGRFLLAEYLYSAVINADKTYLEKFKSLLQECGISYSLENPEDKNEWFGIDHADELKEFLDAVLSNKDMFLRYLFNPDSYIYTTNDNEYDFSWDNLEADETKYDIFYKGN